MGIGQIEVKLIGYWSEFFFNPTKLDRYTIIKNVPHQLDLYSTNTQSLLDGFSSTWLLDLYSNFLNMSKIFG